MNLNVSSFAQSRSDFKNKKIYTSAFRWRKHLELIRLLSMKLDLKYDY